jgi:hypothetical protein
MDALFGGAAGMLIGTGLFAHFFPKINEKFMDRGVFPVKTVPELVGIPSWIMVVIMVVFMIGFLCILEYLGL